MRLCGVQKHLQERVCVQMSHEKLGFVESLEEDDYGLIICGKTGELKGLWIPDGSSDDYVPDSIIELCVQFFGIDPAEFEDDGIGQPPTETLH